MERPRLVVDLGSGTGLSTRIWAGHSDEVVGIEPNDAMRAFEVRIDTASTAPAMAATTIHAALMRASG